MKTNLLQTCLLAAALLACVPAIPATAQVNYAVSGGTAYVTYSCATGNVVIASTYNGYPVTNIGDSVFWGCTNLTSVTIPNSVTTIGVSAFYNCSSLTSVTIGSSVTNIGYFAFSGCTSLTNFSVDATNLAYSSLDGVLFDKTQTTLIAFPGNRGGSYVIPDSATSIRDEAFFDCTSLTNLSVDAANLAYSSLDGVVFDKMETTLIICPAGRGGSYVVPNSVTSIRDFAFWGCWSLTSGAIPNSVSNIGNYAFQNCGNLTSVAIPDNVTHVGQRAFYSCTKLTSVTIGNGVISIEAGAFSGCTSLTSVRIGNGVTNIDVDAFSRCTSLTSVSIPDSVTNIGNGAFYYCASLANVTIGTNVTSIGSDAFSDCYSLTNVVIGNGVTSIGWYAFSVCTNLTRVTIGNSVTLIWLYAFADCSRLTNLTFLGNAPDLYFSSQAGGHWFDNVGADATVYYYYGTTGWGPTYGGLPTVMLGAPAPQLGTASAGVKPAGFGFTLTGVTNQTIVVEASTDLVNWQPIWTNTLSDASAEFVDPEWLNHPHRFYRLTTP